MELKLSFSDAAIYLFEAFNRTLWNWNEEGEIFDFDKFPLLIVPYGIETLFY